MTCQQDVILMNCCLFDVSSVLKSGFEMGNLWYNEPKSLDVAFDVIGDITMAAASQQYGGFTLPEVDKVLAPYAQKTYEANYQKYVDMGVSPENADIQATKDVEKDFHDGFQGWEYKFNTVASSRGDYPFITVTMGLGQGKFERMASIIMLNVRRVRLRVKKVKRNLFYSLKSVLLFDKNLHAENKPLEDVYEAAIECSQKAMYPDWLSLTGEGYVASMYKKYGKVISPMGCRAFSFTLV